MKGYKIFNPNWTCRGFQYEVGKTYKHEGEIELCESGFHFCEELANCFGYYPFNSDNKVAEVEAIGKIINGKTKSVTDEITIVRELTWYEVLDMLNKGKANTGLGNTGNYNSGDNNSGDFNTGDQNIGDCNTGFLNSGRYNTGRMNSGDHNTGNKNVGNENTGSFNLSSHNVGFFNTKEPKLNFFNKPSNWTYQDWIDSKARLLFLKLGHLTDWSDCPDCACIGGYLGASDYKAIFREWWSKLTTKEKQIIKELPNFDADIFEEITGIEIE